MIIKLFIIYALYQDNTIAYQLTKFNAINNFKQVINVHIFFLAPSESAVKKRIRTLGYLHVFLPNIMMFVAFVLWGVTEGESFKSINHTVTKPTLF